MTILETMKMKNPKLSKHQQTGRKIHSRSKGNVMVGIVRKESGEVSAEAVNNRKILFEKLYQGE
jgi:hypothetical protein